MTNDGLKIRRFEERDAPAVRSLFIRVNRLLAPPGMEDAFERYIERSIEAEIGRIGPYYAERDGLFFVAEQDGHLAGMFGLERAGQVVLELRRMYVAPECRGMGYGRELLAAAEAEARRLGAVRLILSTSEVQQAALGVYRSSGYAEVAETAEADGSNKVLGGGLRRFHFEKRL
ncbi:MAG: GNAT family N-acetyltransferase [Minwuia sp.]|uniref:GNAT family N-acetyltransferase n=1 Tax=Minwuia sp. TaxID=2493630 RepID=UPI003A838B8C